MQVTAPFSNVITQVADPGGGEGAMAPPWPCENRS